MVTLDLLMPRSDGFDLLNVIHRRQPDASVIVVTGNDDLEVVVLYIRNGVFDMVTQLLFHLLEHVVETFS